MQTDEQLSSGIIPELDTPQAARWRKHNQTATQIEIWDTTPQTTPSRHLPARELKDRTRQKLACIQTGGKTGDEIIALQNQAREQARREIEEETFGLELDFYKEA
jgi:hypothetical protein